MNRRKLIKSISQSSLFGMFSSPFSKLMAALINDEVHNYSGSAESERKPIRNYLQINLYGAPSRLGFDHLLKPYSENSFLPYKYVANKIISQDAVQLHEVKFEYSTVSKFGLNVPVQWTQQLPTTTTKFVPMSDLFQNALLIRGCRLDFSGHPLNGMQQVAPVPGGLSIHGVVGDASDCLFSSVCVGNNPVSRSFKSESALLTEIPYTDPNYVEYLLKPFLLQKKDQFYKESDLDREFAKIAQYYPSPLKNLSDLKKKALANMRRSIDPFLNEYAGLVAKYSELIKKALKSYQSSIRVKCPPVPFAGSGQYKNLREMLGPFTVMDQLYLEDDPVRFLMSGQLNYWAQEFALSEFLLVHNLSQSILISAPSPDIGYVMADCTATDKVQLEHLNLTYDDATKNSSVEFKVNPETFEKGIRKKIQNNSENVGMDAHGTGLVYELLSNEIFYRALSTCLLELIHTLKGKNTKNGNLFEQTIIHVASEFDRVPLTDGSGSDHNALANPTCIFSGCIKEPTVLGNIYVGTLDENRDRHYGTLGNGAPVKELGTSVKIGHVSSTLSKLVGVKSILPRQPSLIDFKDGKIESLIEKPRNLEGYI